MVSKEIHVKKFRKQDVLDLIERKYKQVGLSIVKDDLKLDIKGNFDCKMRVAGEPQDLERFARETKRLGYAEKT